MRFASAQSAFNFVVKLLQRKKNYSVTFKDELMPQHMWKRIEGTGFFVVVKGKKSKYEITYSVFPTFLAKIALALAQKQKYVLGGFC